MHLTDWIVRQLAGEAPEAAPPSPPVQGAFVRVTAGDRLVGFLGSLDRPGPLAEVALDLAREALTADPRFEPAAGPVQVTVWRVGPSRPLAAPGELHAGREGVSVVAGLKRAVHLPGLDPDQDTDTEAFVESACIAAGIGPAGWRWEGARLVAFEAERIDPPDNDAP